MTDALLRRAERAGDRAALALARARAGRCAVRRWDGYGTGTGTGTGNGNGNGYGNGDGNGYGYGNGYGNGNGYGKGYGNGNGHGDGYGDGHGNGYGNGYGNGDGYGNGYGNGYGKKGDLVTIEDVIERGASVVVRSYVSGVIVGRLRAGSAGSVALTDWRWIRCWEEVGGEGSVYDLVASGKVPTQRGPLTAEVAVFQQADVMVVDEATYSRLAA